MNVFYLFLKTVCGFAFYVVGKKCLSIEEFKILMPNSGSAIDQSVYDTLSRPSQEKCDIPTLVKLYIVYRFYRTIN